MALTPPGAPLGPELRAIVDAANDHWRFVRARWQHDLVFSRYAQDALVDARRA